MIKRLIIVAFFIIIILPIGFASNQIEKTNIPLDIPAPQDSAGGIIVADVNDDGARDFLVTVPGHLAVYDNSGEKLWIKKTDIGVSGQSESQGLPGHNGPGVAAGDVDGDGKTEVIYLTKHDSAIHIVDGKTGKGKHSSSPPVPEGAECWEVACIADFRGLKADHDLLLQATNKDGYRMGRYLAAYSFDNLIANKSPLWTTDNFVSCAHNGARLADLDGDNRDEVLGATIFSHGGKLITKAKPFRGHMDSVSVADVFGDWREEIIVLNGNELHIYENLSENSRPNHKRLWLDRNYRRLKQCHNYYSP